MGEIGIEPGLSLVFRGDPTSYDFQVGDLTTDGVWHDLDLSGIVPEGASAVILKLIVADDSATSEIHFRKKTGTTNLNQWSTKTRTVTFSKYQQGIVFCDTNRVIQYWASNTTWTTINLLVVGWFI